MWKTSEGDRVLRGEEAAIFQKGLASLLYWLDETREHQQWDVGVQVFDKLSHPEKLAALEIVASALLQDAIPAPKLTAVLEGAIAAVYAQLIGDVDVEIDDGDGDTREALAKGVAGTELEEVLPTASSNDGEQWRELIELFADRILWDRDWMEDWVKPDDPPEVADKVRDFALIDANYYSAVPPDPNPEQLRRIQDSLSRLLKLQG